ncbi:unnamed protein product [Closterium sp. NIES-64]|nr:unnamed protein product [Closterium sp. NIES-64]
MASRLLAAASRAARSASGRRSGSIAPFRAFSAQAAPAAVQIVNEDRFARYNSPIPITVDHSAALGLIPATRVTTLSNGLRVASEANPNPNAPKTATIGVWIDAGSRYESEATNGTAHFLEHMIFKGTKRRSVQQLEMEVENAGGHLNAYTSREMTTYYAKVVQKDIPVAVDLLGDILQNSLFSEDAVDRERGVILREMQEVPAQIEKQVEKVLFDHRHATAFQFSPPCNSLTSHLHPFPNAHTHVHTRAHAHPCPFADREAGGGGAVRSTPRHGVPVQPAGAHHSGLANREAGGGGAVRSSARHDPPLNSCQASHPPLTLLPPHLTPLSHHAHAHAQIEKQVEEVLFDHLHATAFQFSPLGRTILGSADNVRAITRNDLEKYIATHYTGPRMVVSAAGVVDHDALVKMVEKTFASLPAASTTTVADLIAKEPSKFTVLRMYKGHQPLLPAASTTTVADLIAKEPSKFTGSEVRIRDDDMPLTNFAIAYKGASWTDPDAVALQIMQTMLGSWSRGAGGGNALGPCWGPGAAGRVSDREEYLWCASPIFSSPSFPAHLSLPLHLASPSHTEELPSLFSSAEGGGQQSLSELAQKVAANSLCERFMAFNTNYSDTGLFGVYACAKPDHLDDLAWAMMHEITRLVYRVSDDDVTRAGNALKASLALHLDGSSAVAEDIGRQLITYGRRIPLAEMFARIDAVDAETVKRVAERFLMDRDVAVAAIGPTQFLPDYNWLRRRTFWLRY